MSPNNNFNILAWYDSIEQQNHRKAYVYGTVWGLIAPNNSILPFQFVSPGSLGNVASVVVKSLETAWAVDLTSKITVSVTNYTDDDGNAYSIVMHKGDNTLSSKLPEGRHYIILKQGSKTWYSEVFTVVSNINCFIKLEYWDNSNLYFKGGHIEYLTGFKFVCYLSTEIGKPKYPFEEELTERDGYKFIEKQTSSKVYNMTFCAPEFMCDALRLVRMCDNIHITNQGKVYRALSFSVNVDWEDNGDVAAVDAEFETDTVVTKIANVLNGPSESGSTFNDALLYEKSSPLMFGEGVVAQYTRTVQVTVEAQFVGKLIRELDEYLSEQIPETAYIAVDLGDGPALKFPLSKLSDKYWNYVSNVAEDYLIPKVAKHIFSNKDVVAYATGKYDIVLPIASASALGAIKIGDGLAINSEGVVSVTGAGSGSIAGITISPNTGNVLTGATLSADGKTITFAKDLTAITTANYTTTLDTRYVKKSGDTMTGTLVLPYGSANNTIGLYFKNSDATQGAVLRWNGTDAVILSGTGYNTSITNSIYFSPLGTTGADIMAVRSNNLVDVYGSLHAASDIIAYSTGSGDIVLPIASVSALGAVKVGSGLTIASDGTLSATGAGSISGISISPNTGNVLTGATLSADGKAITFAKDITALTTTNYSSTLDTKYVKKSGDTMTGALTATSFVSNIATGTSPLSVASTTLCNNLNADMLDGIHYQNILERRSSGKSYTAGTPGWFRIGETIGGNHNGICFLLFLSRGYTSANNEVYVFSISIAYNGSISITQLSGIANSRLITKIRIDCPSGKIAYIDIYANDTTVRNDYHWFTIGAAKSYTSWTANPTLVGTAYEFTTDNGLKSDKSISSSVATGTSPLSVTSTTLCSNLNADLLDGVHASGLFTSLSNSGNNISVTVGGTNKTLTVGYASNADMLDGIHYQNILERRSSGKSYTAGTPGWFRIGETIGGNHNGICFLLFLYRGYANSNNEAYIFSISIAYNGSISITQLSGIANVRLITKIRIDCPSGKIAYIDIYANDTTVQNDYCWATIGAATSYTSWTANPTLVGTAYEFTTDNGLKSDKSISSTSDIIAYSTGTTSAPFQYWKPYVDADGNLSWTNTTSTTVPPTRNIKGAKGDNGGWAGGNYTDSTLCIVTNNGGGGLKFCRTSDTTAIKVGGGNGITGYSGAGFNTMGNLYFNWNSDSINVRVDKDAYLYVRGVNVSSDMRLKDKVSDVEGALDKINTLNIFYYKWKSGPDETHIGVSAQQVQTIFPELVKENDTNDVSPETENYLTVDYQCLSVAGLQAIKELYQLVKQQQNKIDNLETKLAN